MSIEKYEEDCPGCRPAIMTVNDNGETEPLGDDTPEMVAINRLWDEQDEETKRAWHDFTCLNSRDPEVTKLVGAFSTKMNAALREVAQ